ncbi:MAG: hypothetical protein U0704_11805 [Candidatus Eisenbacteria bacterium]
MMNCEEFARLLDRTAGEGLPEEAFAHAARCARCTSAFADARSLERMLESAGGEAGTSSAFTDRVMTRVAATPQVRIAPVSAPRGSWRDVLSAPVLAAAASALALLVVAAGNGFDPVRIAAVLLPGSGGASAMPAFALPAMDAAAARWAWLGIAGAIGMSAALAGWWLGAAGTEDRPRRG